MYKNFILSHLHPKRLLIIFVLYLVHVRERQVRHILENYIAMTTVEQKIEKAVGPAFGAKVGHHKWAQDMLL